LSDPKHAREFQHVVSHYRYSDYIANFGSSNQSREYLLEQYPQTFLIHSRGYVKEVGKVLRRDYFKNGVPNIAK